MKNFLIAFSVFLVWSFFGLWLYSWMQNDKDSAVTESNIAKSEVIDELEETMNDSLNIENDQALNQTINIEKEDIKDDSDGIKAINTQGDFIFFYSEGISTEINSSEIIIPKSSIDFKYKLNTYLIEHPDEQLHIHSIYSPVENIDTPNLGIQRGEKMKEILIDVGIPNERIVIKPVIKGINSKENDWTKNIIYFTFNPFNEKRKIELTIPKKKIIYPNYSNSGILINKELKVLLSDIKNNLSRNPELKVEIVGHTDYVGSGIDNYRMGLKDARQVRWYLISNGGFKSDQIIATSRGEDEPIDSNKENKDILSNRRIEVIYY